MADRDRIYWQCRRGMLELDILLQAFLANGYDNLSEQEKQAFETLLTYPDQILIEYLMGRMAPIDGSISHVVSKIRHPALS